jgi:hypothetical protein
MEQGLQFIFDTQDVARKAITWEVHSRIAALTQQRLPNTVSSCAMLEKAMTGFRAPSFFRVSSTVIVHDGSYFVVFLGSKKE